jgi:hypothetical protein
MATATDSPMTDREMREVECFIESVRGGTGPLNAAIEVGWTPAALKRRMKDPEFVELVELARERRLESIETTLYQMAERGHFKAIQMVLYNERAHRWKDVRHLSVTRSETLDVGIVVSVKEAAKQLLREHGVASAQPAAIETTARVEPAS